MVLEQFYYSRRLYINTRQDTRDKGKVDGKNEIRNIANEDKTKNTFDKLKTFELRDVF